MNDGPNLSQSSDLRLPNKDPRLEIPFLPDTVRVRWAGDIVLADTNVALVPSSLTLDSDAREAARKEFAKTMER